MDRGGIGSCCDTMEDALWHLGCRSRGGSLGCRGARCLLSGSDGTVFEAEPIELGARHLFQDAGVVHAANEGEFSQQPCIHATPLFAIRLGAESSLQPVSTELTLLRTLQEASPKPLRGMVPVPQIVIACFLSEFSACVETPSFR